MEELDINNLGVDFKKIWPYVVHKSKNKYDIYIGRPSQYGNPFSHQENTIAQFRVSSRLEAVFKYKEYVMSKPDMIDKIKKELKGKVLGCWCSPDLCHGHILAAIANDCLKE